jgi:predicted dehydrogenase
VTVRRLGCVGTPANLAALRRAAEASGVAVASANPTSAATVGPSQADAYDLLCVLDPVPELDGLVERHGRAGTSVLLAGPPSEDPAVLDRLGAAFAATGAALGVGGPLRYRPVCRALPGVVRSGRVGAPVYLRFAASAGDAASLLWLVADAVDYASELLGDAQELYAVGVGRAPDSLRHLALTLRHRGGAVALLDLGVSERGRGLDGVLLLGDRGAAEDAPGAGGLVVDDGEPNGRTVPLRDERVDALTAWLRAGLERSARVEEQAPELARGWRLAAALATVRRSLASGSAEPLGGQAVGPSVDR